MTPTTETLQQQFNLAYWASQSPEIQELAGIADHDAREAQAATLAQSGAIIDVPIMVWGWDAFVVMTMRQQFGYVWVPSALQPPIAIGPGLTQPGIAPYNPNNPPPGSIHVSTNIADYPPYTVHPSTPVPTITDPVGAQSLGNIYLPVVGDSSPAGARSSDSRGTFIKQVVATPFGNDTYWLKVA